MSPVFNEAKYRALLEKLEVSIVSKTKILSSDSKFRVDAEFYQKKYIACERMLNGMPSKGFSSFCYSIKKGIFDLSPEHYLKQGVPFVRTSEIKNPTIDFSTTVFLDEKTHQANTKTELQPYDIVFTKIGAYIGDVALLPPDYTMYNFSQNVAGARIKQKELSPYLLAFFCSTVGQNMIIRTSMLSGQGKLELDDIRNYRIPIFSEKFTHDIKILFENSIAIGSSSISKYKTAEQLLLQELGLTDWQPDDESVATKTFADFQTFGRLDAEYYQPKYQAIAEKLAQYNNGTVSCKNVLTNAMTKLTSGTQYCYLELADIGKSGEINSCTHDIAENLPSRARQKVKTNDVIVSSVEGSLTSCALITEEYNNAICSTGFHVLRSAEINSETLLLLMKSSPIQALLKQGCSGTILTAILPDALKAIKLPLIRKEVQTELAAKVQESFALRKESKRMLDLAKHAVEVAIEQGEDAAQKILDSAFARKQAILDKFLQ